MDKWPGFCKRSGGMSEPDADGDRHMHTCGQDKGHSGRHVCEICQYSW